MPVSVNIEKFLENAELFSGLTKTSRAALAEICLPREVAKNEVIFREGDPGLALFFLVLGNIKLSKSSDDGRNIVIRVMKEGEMFGEVVLFEKSKYPVTATAMRKSLVFQLPRQQFDRMLLDDRFRADFLSGLMKKLRYLADKIKYLSLHDVEDRLRIFLREQYGEKPVIRPTVSKKNIAAAIATTPETLSRLLARLKQEGVLNWDGTMVKVTADFWKRGAISHQEKQ